jgi:hypothetical protein
MDACQDDQDRLISSASLRVPDQLLLAVTCIAIERGTGTDGREDKAVRSDGSLRIAGRPDWRR